MVAIGVASARLNAAPLLQLARPVIARAALAQPCMALSPEILGASGALEQIGSALAFADQGQNLAGIFFQASLLPYLGFLYFLGYEANRTPKVSQFGFTFLLLFVISTVVTGIVSKSVYGCSLADVDWLHGAAEALLTTSNLYVAFGFRNALAGDAEPQGPTFRYPALGVGLAVFAAAALGPSTLGFAAHDPFLFGAGALPADLLAAAPLSAEPVNALSVPTWAIHFSSVFEWLFAMGMVWQYAEATGNPKWRGLTWGMLPLHASGVAACTYHFFYNAQPDLQFLVELQAFLTLLGNSTVCFAALRIALSNGWTLQDLVPAFLKKDFDTDADANTQSEPTPLKPVASPPQPAALLAAEGLLLTLATSYLVKYGELLVPSSLPPFQPNQILAGLIVLSIPSLVSYRFAQLPPLSKE